jgi:hypothetical protein
LQARAHCSPVHTAGNGSGRIRKTCPYAIAQTCPYAMIVLIPAERGSVWLRKPPRKTVSRSGKSGAAAFASPGDGALRPGADEREGGTRLDMRVWATVGVELRSVFTRPRVAVDLSEGLGHITARMKASSTLQAPPGCRRCR